MKKQLGAAVVFAISMMLVATWIGVAQAEAYLPSARQGEFYQPPVILSPPNQAQSAQPGIRGQRPRFLPEEELAGGPRLPNAPGGGSFEVSFFYDDLENGCEAWDADGFWHIPTAGSAYANAYHGAASWWYGLDATGTYESGSEANSGAIQAGPVQIVPGAPAAYLRFWSWEYTEGSAEFDTRKVYTSTNGSDWVQVWQSNPSYDRAFWYEVLIDLSSSIGKTIYLRFEFDTVDGSHNGYRGWYIDNVGIGYDPIQLFPSAQVGYGYAGELINYPAWPPGDMWVENNLELSTTLAISSQGVWDANFPASLGILLPGDRWHFGGNVEIPAGAPAGDYNDTILHFTAQTSPTHTQTQTIRTWVGWVHIQDYRIYDDGSGLSQGDGDGQIDPGETIEISLTLKNDLDRAAMTVWGYLEPDYLMWLDSSEAYGDIPAGSSVVSENRYRYTVPSWVTPGTMISFDTWIFSRYIGWSDTFSVSVPYSLALEPDSLASGDPGATITYNLTLQNWSGVADQFSLSLLDHTWAATLSPTQTDLMANGASTPVTVTVVISNEASVGHFDAATVKAAGLGPAAHMSATAVLTSTAACLVEGESAHTTTGALDDLYYLQPVYIYLWAFVEDNDSLHATVTGFNRQTGVWDTLVDVSGTGSGVLMEGGLAPVYTRLRVYLFDDEYNDEIYYIYRIWDTQCNPVSLTSKVDTRLAAPGQIITYTGRLENKQAITDTFNLSLSADWPTELHNGTQLITQTPTLPAGSAIDVTIQIEVPASAQAAAGDIVTVRAVSAYDEQISATLEITTIVLGQGWFQAYGENYPAAPQPDHEAYLDAVTGQPPWALTQDRHDVSSPAVSAFCREQIVYAWTRYRSNAYNFWVNEVEFGARTVTGEQTISNTLIIDHSAWLDNIYEYDVAVAVDPVNGRIGLAWVHSDRAAVNDPWRWNIYYAVYDPQGAVLQPPTPLTFNLDDHRQDYTPAIEAFRQGQFAISWEHLEVETSTSSVVYAVVSDLGELIKAPTELTPNVGEFDDYDPRLAQMLDGSMMILWEAEVWDTGDREVAFARLDPQGNLLNGQTTLTDYAQAVDADPEAQNLDAAALSNGHTVIAWSVDGLGTGSTIYFAVVDPAYQIIAGPTALANPRSNDNVNVSVVEDGDGHAVLTWGKAVIYYALIDSHGAVLIWPEIYHRPRNTTLNLNGKGYGSGGMPARPLTSVSLPFITR